MFSLVTIKYEFLNNYCLITFRSAWLHRFGLFSGLLLLSSYILWRKLRARSLKLAISSTKVLNGSSSLARAHSWD